MKHTLRLFVSFFIALLFIGSGWSAYHPPVRAQEAVTPSPTAAAERPFRLPFDAPPGLDTWLLAQPYGNTTGAYFQRFTTYGASGGIHFGVDLAAPCGTDILAIADGVVYAIDGPYGSPPHNLMIDHPELGYASMYGHLLAAPALQPGQAVERGQVVAQVGDSGGDCGRYPHLHLEIRDLNHIRKYNPTTLIEADWDFLALYGDGPRTFMRNLDEPRQWQSLYDQPEVQTGGPIVNNFARTWPPDWSQATNSSTAAPSDTDEATTSLALPPASRPPLPAGVRPLTADTCCTNFYWSRDSTEIRFIDRPSGQQPLGIWGVNIDQGGPAQLVSETLGYYNGDGTLVSYPDRTRGLSIVEDVGSGERWEIDTDESSVSFTPDGQQILWISYDSEVPWRSRTAEVWLANIDGSSARRLAAIRRGGPVAWLGNEAVLVTSRIPPSQDTLLSRLSLADGTLTELIRLPRLSGLSISPDDRHLVYLVRFEGEQKNGLWLLDLQAPELEPQRLPFFGSYRWRDSQRLVYLPFSAAQTAHVFYEYDLRSGESRPLFPTNGDTLPLTITNNDWQVSPDGRKIGLLAANSNRLDGIWLVELPD